MAITMKEAFSYNPETGHITRASTGRRAGTLACDGYRRITYRRKYYREHRVAWFLTYGYWPTDGNEIDHVNGIRSDNRLCNLRDVTIPQNRTNKACYKNNTSGFKGVSRSFNLWSARIQKDGKRVLIGRYKTEQEAGAAYAEMAPKTFGEFARAA